MNTFDDLDDTSSSEDDEDVEVPSLEVKALVNSAKKVIRQLSVLSLSSRLIHSTEETCRLSSCKACKGMGCTSVCVCLRYVCEYSSSACAQRGMRYIVCVDCYSCSRTNKMRVYPGFVKYCRSQFFLLTWNAIAEELHCCSSH